MEGSLRQQKRMQAALEFLLQTGRQPDILHCHDWSTAILAEAYWCVTVPDAPEMSLHGQTYMQMHAAGQPSGHRRTTGRGRVDTYGVGHACLTRF